MTLADTSVWIDHLRQGNTRLKTLLVEHAICCHPFIVGELACGHLDPRASILRDLSVLPSVEIATQSEVLNMLESMHLYGRGLGWVDAHLIAAALLSGVSLWTLDRRLKAVAAELDLVA